jgi:hypothetical protein
MSGLESDIALADKVDPDIIGELDGIAQAHHRLGHLLRPSDRGDRQGKGADEPNTYMTFQHN